MSGENSGVSRRNVLKLAGGSLATLSTTGLVAAKPDDTVEVNVGFASERGRKAALDAASEVVREFAFDAATLRLPKRAAAALAERTDVRYVEEDGRVQALSWGRDRIDAEVANSYGYTGSGADVAVLDTGIDSDNACRTSALARRSRSVRGRAVAIRGTTTTATGPTSRDSSEPRRRVAVPRASRRTRPSTP